MQLYSWLTRLVFSLFGALACAVVVALAESRTACSAAAGTRAVWSVLVGAELGILAPLAAAIGVTIGAVAVLLEPDRAKTLGDYAETLRSLPVLARSRIAALIPLGVLAAFVWCVALAHQARATFAAAALASPTDAVPTSPLAVGVYLAIVGLAVGAVLAALVLATVPWVRRALAAGAGAVPRALDPVSTGMAALALVAGVFVAGIASGNPGGEGGVLGIFGVFRRDELDLRPVTAMLACALGALLGPMAFASRRRSARTLLATGLAGLAPFALTWNAAHHALAASPPVVRAIERGAPLGRLALKVARRVTDRDGDGASPLFAGGDCDDRDPLRSPTALDRPGNGLDEDCSGSDLPMPSEAPSTPTPSEAAARAALPPELNVIFLTIDTLRTDVGFMGYPKAVTPNLDRLAARSTIFDRAYAMASYTGKSIGPMLIGKYPSETIRDGGHFNTYDPANVLVTERARAAGLRTFGAASHWYFNTWSGLPQGMDEWDLSARPTSGQGDNDTTVTSKELGDAALRLLARKANTGRRFFSWFHFIDPHAQYMPHEGAPDFARGESTYIAQVKGKYDAEVWFADKHVGRLLDFVAAQPWGDRTAIVVTSDHGEAFAEHNMSWHGVDIWESLVRIPLLIYVPGARPHHVPVKRSHIDLVPTLLDLMGIAPPAPGELSGRSLVDDVVAHEGASFLERDVYFDMPPGPYTGLRRGIITGPTPGMKLVSAGGAEAQLFNLAEDPGELNDLSGDSAQLELVLGAFNAARARVREIWVKPDEPKVPGAPSP